MAHVHESPNVMLIPLYVLAIGAVFSGVVLAPYFVGSHMEEFWGEAILVLPQHQALENAHHAPLWVKWLPLVVAVLGIAAAYYAYRMKPDIPGIVATRLRAVHLFLYNKWYFDELYDWLFVNPAKKLGRNLWKEGDGTIIDGLGPDGIAAVARNLAERASRLQSGYVYHYAFAMMIGVVVLVTWYLSTRGA
jgi:NADH-quinone oxidoreductase subunit L